MSWQDIIKTDAKRDAWYMANANPQTDTKQIEDKIADAPQYVKTAWGEVLRWLGEQQ